MKTNYRTILAGAIIATTIIAATLGAGCMMIIASDDPHHQDEICADCHYTIDVYGKRVADTTTVTASEQCPR